MINRTHFILVIPILFFYSNVQAQEVCEAKLQDFLPTTQQEVKSIYESIPGDHQAVACAIELCDLQSGENPTISTFDEPIVEASAIDNLEEKEIKDMNLLINDYITSVEDKLLPENKTLNFNKDSRMLAGIVGGWGELSVKAYLPYFENINDLSEVCTQVKEPCPPGVLALRNKLTSDMKVNPLLTAYHLKEEFGITLANSSNLDNMVQTSVNHLKEMIRDPKKRSSQDKSLEALISLLGDPITEEKISQIFQNYYFLYKWSQDALGDNSVPFCESKECRRGAFEVVAKTVKNNSDSLRKALREPDMKTKLAAACIAAMSGATERDKGVKNFYQRLPQLKERFLSLGLRNMSAKSKASFEDFMNTKLSIDAGSILEISNLDKISKLREVYRLRAASIDENEKLDDIVRNSYHVDDLVSSFSYTCSSLSFDTENFDDQFIFASEEGASSVVRASYFSCNHSDTGDQIFYHELGHALSFFFKEMKVSPESRKEYLETRSCVTGNYQGSVYAKSIPPYFGFNRSQDNLYTEEDTADHFGAIVSKGYKKLKACALLPNSNSHFGLNIPPIEGDTHSSKIVRLIRNAIYHDRELPPVCKNIVQQYGKRIFRKCE